MLFLMWPLTFLSGAFHTFSCPVVIRTIFARAAHFFKLLPSSELVRLALAALKDKAPKSQWVNTGGVDFLLTQSPSGSSGGDLLGWEWGVHLHSSIPPCRHPGLQGCSISTCGFQDYPVYDIQMTDRIRKSTEGSARSFHDQAQK